MNTKPRIAFIMAVASWLFFTAGLAHAQEAISTVAPVTTVEEQPLATGTETVVLELFSSQACVFCPKADQLLADLVKLDNVIGLNCHVDYFNVSAGSLARPFCTTRQNGYMQALGAGPNYTPQMIVNGAAEVVGYKLNDINAAIKKAQSTSPLMDIKITKGAAPDDFTLSWNAATAAHNPATLWLMLIDKPHDLDIAEGRNKGQRISYVNIVSSIEDRGDWNVASQTESIKVTLTDQHAGLIVIAQEKNNGKIVAAGKFSTLPPISP